MVPVFVFCASRAAGAQTGGFVVTLGRDTVQVEQFRRTADLIEGTVVFRSPVIRQVRYRLQLDGGNNLVSYTQSIYGADGRKIEPSSANVTMTVSGDTVIREGMRGNEAVTHRIAAPEGVVPLLGISVSIPFAYSYLTYELARAQALARSQNGESRLILLGPYATQTSPQMPKVWHVGKDSMEMDYFGVARSGFRFDAEGRLLRSDWTATTYKYKVVRVAGVDVEAIAQGWGAAEAAGRGFGRYSPRDTSRATIDDASIWIDYSRPSKRGRQIWGGVVPFGEVWRLGADFATQLNSDATLSIGEVTVPAGRYSLWMLPSPDAPLLIINGQHGQFGTQYDARQDLARIPLVKSSVTQPVEQLTMRFGDRQLRIEWDSLAFSVPVRVNSGMTGQGSDSAQAVGAARAWLGLVDGGKYAASTDSAAPLFRQITGGPDGWQRFVTAARSRYPVSIDRTLVNWESSYVPENAPAGRYVRVTFASNNAQRTRESIVLVHTETGWRVAMYGITGG
jgi:hypothetical protein